MTPERLAEIRRQHALLQAAVELACRHVDPESLHAYLGELLEEVNSLGLALAAAHINNKTQ